MVNLKLSTELCEIFGYTPKREAILQDIIYLGDDGYKVQAPEFADDVLYLHLALSDYIPKVTKGFCAEFSANNWGFDENGCYRLKGSTEKYQLASPLSQNEVLCTADELSMAMTITASLWLCEQLNDVVQPESYNTLIYLSERLKSLNSDSYKTVEGYNAVSVSKIIS